MLVSWTEGVVRTPLKQMTSPESDTNQGDVTKECAWWGRIENGF